MMLLPNPDNHFEVDDRCSIPPPVESVPMMVERTDSDHFTGSVVVAAGFVERVSASDAKDALKVRSICAYHCQKEFASTEVVTLVRKPQNA